MKTVFRRCTILAAALAVSAIMSGCFEEDLKTLPGSGGSGDLPSTDVQLKYLYIDAGSLSPAFNKNVTAYSTTVEYDVTSAEVTAVALETSTVIIDGTESTLANGFTVTIDISSLPADNSTTQDITVDVTAEDGITTSQYVITVTKNDPPSTDATLFGLTVSAGTLTPGFGSGTTSYSLTVPSDTVTLNVTATVNDPNASLKINTKSASSGSPSAVDISSLPADNSTTMDIDIDVTAEDDLTTMQYTITVKKDLPPATEARLASLTVSTGSLDPSFTPNQKSYNVLVPEGTPSITVTPNAMDPSATIEVDGSPVASGSGKLINLSSFPRSVIIDTTAADMITTDQYIIMIDEEEGTGCGG